MLLAGVVAAACLPDVGVGPFVWNLTPYSFPLFALCICALFIAVNQWSSSRLHSFLYAYFWGFGYFLLGLDWVGNALLIDGNPYVWAYPLALVGLPFLLAFFWGVGGFIVLPLLYRSSTRMDPLVFIAVFSGIEYLRGHLFTGFPWNLPAMYWANTPPVFQGFASAGPYGMTFLTLLWSISILLAITGLRTHRTTILVSVLSFAAVYFHGAANIESTPKPTNSVQIVMIQANIPQSEKWDGSKISDHFYDHIALSARPKGLAEQPTIIIWPETALAPSYISSPVVRDAVRDLLVTYPAGSVLFTGALRGARTATGDAYYNSAIIYDQTGTPRLAYDKHHLVPFGEYMPFQKYIPLGPITQFDGLDSGPGPVTINVPGIPPFSPLICYEIIFSGQIAASESKKFPDWIVNLTNDSWYGDTGGPRQHLAQARARAVENSFPVVRVAGTGISAAIDRNGQIIDQIPYDTKGTKLVRFNIDPTATIYQQMKDWPFVFFVLSILISAVFSRSRK